MELVVAVEVWARILLEVSFTSKEPCVSCLAGRIFVLLSAAQEFVSHHHRTIARTPASTCSLSTRAIASLESSL